MSNGEVMYLMLVLGAMTTFAAVLFYQDWRQRKDGN